jgi:hypothetical protein
VADAEVLAFPTVPHDPASLVCVTFGETFTALAVQLDQGKVAEVRDELLMLARDYGDVEIPVLSQDL